MEQSVVNQAMMHGLLQALPMGWAHLSWNINLNTKVVQARGILRLLGRHSNNGSLLSELVLAHVHGSIKAGTRAQRCKKEFGRCHPFIESTIFGGLITNNGVLSGLDFKLYCS